MLRTLNTTTTTTTTTYIQTNVMAFGKSLNRETVTRSTIGSLERNAIAREQGACTAVLQQHRVQVCPVQQPPNDQLLSCAFAAVRISLFAKFQLHLLPDLFYHSLTSSRWILIPWAFSAWSTSARDTIIMVSTWNGPIWKPIHLFYSRSSLRK